MNMLETAEAPTVPEVVPMTPEAPVETSPVDVTGLGGMDSMPQLRSQMKTVLNDRQNSIDKQQLYESKLGDTEKELSTLESQRTAALEPVRNLGIMATERERSDLQLERIPQENPVKIMDPKETKGFFSSAMLFSGLLGLVTRGDMYDALGHLTSSMEGYHAGRKEYADREHENFKTKMQVILDNNKAKLEEFQSIMKKDKDDLEMIRSKLQFMSAKYDDQKGLLLAKKGDILGLLKHYDSMAKSSGLLAMQYQRMISSVDAKSKAESNKDKEWDRRHGILKADRIAMDDHKTEVKAHQHAEGMVNESNQSLDELARMVNILEQNPNVLGVKGKIVEGWNKVAGMMGGQVSNDAQLDYLESARIFRGLKHTGIVGPGNISQSEWKTLYKAVPDLSFTMSQNEALATLRSLYRLIYRKKQGAEAILNKSAKPIEAPEVEPTDTSVDPGDIEGGSSGSEEWSDKDEARLRELEKAHAAH